MNLELRLQNILAACKVAEWYSTEPIDYDLDLSLGMSFAERKIVFFNGSVLEFTESIGPGRFRCRCHYMNRDGNLIFRYDNVPHHCDVATFPAHKHYPNSVVETDEVDLKRVVEEVISQIAEEN